MSGPSLKLSWIGSPTGAAILFLAGAATACEKPWVFFDLGADTLVHAELMSDAENALCEKDFPQECPGLKNVRFMPGALEYLRDLKAKGYTLGLISNVPPHWGVKRLKRALEKPWWIDSRAMDWSLFADERGERIHVPESKEQRKPNPYMFRKALAQAKAAGCPAVYQTAIEKELAPAARGGLIPFEVKDRPAGRYMKESELQSVLRGFARPGENR